MAVLRAGEAAALAGKLAAGARYGARAGSGAWRAPCRGTYSSASSSRSRFRCGRCERPASAPPVPSAASDELPPPGVAKRVVAS
eukprot:3300857-Prymnesium_polylepis.1